MQQHLLIAKLRLKVFLRYFRVQELIAGEQRETGRIPRTLECHLTADLCDSCVPGDTVTVTGIVRVANDGTKHVCLYSGFMSMTTLKSHLYFTGISRGNKDQCMFLIYLEAISVSNNKGA